LGVVRGLGPDTESLERMSQVRLEFWGTHMEARRLQQLRLSALEDEKFGEKGGFRRGTR
jgi:hypothetical protein